jgi:hypothetical protein
MIQAKHDGMRGKSHESRHSSRCWTIIFLVIKCRSRSWRDAAGGAASRRPGCPRDADGPRVVGVRPLHHPREPEGPRAVEPDFAGETLPARRV